MLINIIESYRKVVAVCDEELLGKRFEQDKFQLDVKESFFKGKKFSPEEAEEILKDMLVEDATFNIVGEESTETALKAGIINRESIGEISGIPFALVLM